MKTLPAPTIGRCWQEEIFLASVSALELDWAEGSVDEESRTWAFPEGVQVSGPPAKRFGALVYRVDEDDYAVHIVWNQTHFAWNSVSRRQLEESCLGGVLASLGTDLQYLLDQPVIRSGNRTNGHP